jgi:hypothetical protein
MNPPDTPTRLGLVLVVLYALQATLGVDWGPLMVLQQEEIFRRWSGLALVSLVALQWTHPVLRRVYGPRQQERLGRLHHWLGCVVVLAFFVHASGPGPGYLALLSYTMFVSLLTGMTQPTVAAGKPLSRFLLVLHVLLAVVVLFLSGFHIWAVFAYSP